MAERRAEDYAWDLEEETVRASVVADLGPELAAQVSDTTMMRFIRGYYYEEPRAEKTAAILRETLAWRDEFGVDGFLEAPDAQMLKQCQEYRDVFHLDIFGRDDTGHVIMCQVGPLGAGACASADAAAAAAAAAAAGTTGAGSTNAPML